MKFGLHYLMSCSEDQRPEARYRDSIEQATYAEALGFESVWPVEQHFNQRVSALPCPAMLLAAIAARTNTLRLGTGIVQLPLAHPIRVAEEMATLDVLSGGRAELGVGRGTNPDHFAGLGIPLAESRERFVESLALVRLALAEERFSFKGRFFEVNELELAPHPVQRPRFPIRIAANSAETMEFAGRCGLPILAAAHVNPLPKLRELLSLYHQARRAAGHREAVGDDVSLLMPLFVGTSTEQVQRLVSPTLARYVHLVSSALVPAVSRSKNEAEREHLLAMVERMRKTTFDSMRESMGVFGTPGACIERLEQIGEELQVGRVIAWFNLGGLVPHHQVVRAMELFASDVMPALKSR